MKYLLIIISAISFNASADDLATEKALAEAYLLEMQKEPKATVIQDNIVIRTIYTSSSLERPNLNATVEVMYEGFDREGKVFDSSFLRDQTATFPLSGVILCWQKAVPQMTVGSVYKITCPADQAYGDKGAGSLIKPGAAISFRVVLLNVK